MVAFSSFIVSCALVGAGDTYLIDFGSQYCGPCQEMKPTIQRLAADGYPVYEVDIDQHSQYAAKFGVTHVPCFVMVSGNREVRRVVGKTSYDQLVRMFSEAGWQRPAPPRSGSDGPTFRGQSPDHQRPPIRSRIGEALERRRAGAQETRNTSNESGFSPPGNLGPPPSEQGGTLPTTQDRALQATVRLKVEDARGADYGTGTIIDTFGNEALVVTCGHIFRDSAGKGRITVELCGEGNSPVMRGQLIAYDANERDIALVSFRPQANVESMRVAPAGYQLKTGMPVFSVGCNRGGPASVIASHVSGIDRYVGPPNVEVAGQPVQGRSGGGLFSNDGMLIGVCNAADPRDNEGIYAALSVVQWQLDQIGQQRVYNDTAGAIEQQSPIAASNAEPASPSPPLMPREAPFDMRGDASVVGMGPDSDFEMICIVRPRGSAGGRSEAIVISTPSAELLDLVQRESGGGGQLQALRTPQTTPTPRNVVVPQRDAQGRIIRAQSAQ